MSLYSEIERITQAKADLRDALEAKGATIDESATLDSYVEVVDDLSGDTGKEMIERDTSVMVIDDTVTKIGDYAFYHNTALTSIEINSENSQLKSIGDHAFDNCSNLTEIWFAGQPIVWYGSNVFYNCNKITQFESPLNLVGSIDVPSDASMSQMYLFGSVNFGNAYTLGSDLQRVDCTYCSKVPNINATVLNNIPNATFSVPATLYDAWTSDGTWSSIDKRINSVDDPDDMSWTFSYVTSDDSSVSINGQNSICTVIDHYYDEDMGRWVVNMFGKPVMNSNFFGSNVNKIIDFYFDNEMLYIGNVFKNNYDLSTIHFFSAKPPKFGWGNADDNNYNSGLLNSKDCTIYLDSPQWQSE